ncbi:MAG: thiamine biosynthesis protein [Desulfobulbus sp.]|nr:MAG: thiamine biosynthesis protein [Desulfobulbus sp.]
MSQVSAIALFSGGLDSILACRVIMAQGIRVIALKFVTPFFDDHLLDREDAYQEEVRRKYGIEVRLVDLSEGYVQLVANPAHGYGKHFNPCIDCKIYMLGRARTMLPEYKASFLISGEVLGQRPMSQRMDTLRVIERESGCAGILLRPLCARRLPETDPERTGLVRRELLHAMSGRGRKEQIRLAAEFGIGEYPSPAGGCMLTDPNLGERIARYYQDRALMQAEGPRAADIRLLLVGRQFRLPGGHWFVLGRNEAENERIAVLAEPGDWLLTMRDRPGPTGLLRRGLADSPVDSGEERKLMELAGGLVARYGRKTGGRPLPAEVRIERNGEPCGLTAAPLPDDVFREWQL